MRLMNAERPGMRVMMASVPVTLAEGKSVEKKMKKLGKPIMKIDERMLILN